MDFEFITQLYYGNITPNVRDMPRGSALERADRAFSDAEKVLMSALTGADKNALLNLLNAHAEIVGTEAFEGFRTGFRLGALAILDILTGTNQIFPDG